MSKFLDVTAELDHLLAYGNSDQDRKNELISDLKKISSDKVNFLFDSLDADTAIMYMWLWFLSIKYNKSNLCVYGDLIKVKNIFREDGKFPKFK